MATQQRGPSTRLIVVLVVGMLVTGCSNSLWSKWQVRTLRVERGAAAADDACSTRRTCNVWLTAVHLIPRSARTLNSTSSSSPAQSFTNVRAPSGRSGRQPPCSSARLCVPLSSLPASETQLINAIYRSRRLPPPLLAPEPLSPGQTPHRVGPGTICPVLSTRQRPSLAARRISHLLQRVRYLDAE